ncbi:unnamed protein product [Fraxinus pennsylvanica]|uniref:DUF4283 domain-containing protein n=1 Tax=Fraxinus pennsylvanica TaxID=56036 RepID=A0AAD1YSL7_9LAMI|nr:unnamed protein product [Fraxinus pennsylvanica]
MNRVLDNGPWTFSNHLLLLKHLKEDENPTKVDIFETSLWVQVHDVPAGFRSERVLIQLYETKGEDIERPYGPSLRALLRNNLGLAGERWLRGLSLEDPKSNSRKGENHDMQEENPMKGGENLSAIKGK